MSAICNRFGDFLESRIAEDDNWTDCLPGTVGEAMLRAACLLRQQAEAPKKPPDRSKAAMGTGFFVTRRHLATNYHVVTDHSKITVRVEGTDLPASVVIRDESNDLAVLVLDDSTGSMGRVAIWNFASASSQTLGQKVYTFGFPLGDLLGTGMKYSEGSISSLTGLFDDPRIMQVSLPVQPGNSGGPLFNERGELIGIVVASLDAGFMYKYFGSLPQNVNFAIKSDYLLNLLNMLPEYENEKNASAWPTDNTGLMSTVVQVISK